MLAPRSIPDEYLRWNAEREAPFGAAWWVRFKSLPLRGRGILIRRRMRWPLPLLRRIGAFGFQSNSPARTFEYPWCHDVAELAPGMRVLELGAGASGFQFALAAEGVEVTSVDPLIPSGGADTWQFSAREFQRLNDVFAGGRVRFVNDFLDKAGLPAGHFDRVFAISVIEHIPEEAAVATMREIGRILKPGGRLVATVDLFLDCEPFTDKPENAWGSNVSVKRLVDASGLLLTQGDPRHLVGFPEFDPDAIRAEEDRYLQFADTLTQCLVLEKPAISSGP